MLVKSKKIIFIFWLVFVFALAFLFWYSPILFKGYPAQSIDSEGVITIARNYSEHNVFGLENDLNVVVAPSLVESSANTTSLGNKLTTISYAVIFRLFGQLDWDKVVLVAIAVSALALVFFSITIFYLFGFESAILFSLIYILLPVNGQTAYFVGTYEFAMLFLSIFTVLFFCFRNYKHRWPFLMLSGLFLALSGLSREAMFLSFPIIFLWLWFNKRTKDILLIFIPVILLMVIFWLPSFLSGNNDYFKLFVASKNQEKVHSDYQVYSHLYPDPYTYHFNNQSVLPSDDQTNKSGWLYNIGLLKSQANLGIKQVNIFERLIVGTTDLARQVSKFFSLEDMGGPLIFLLMVLGLYQLRNGNREVYYLFVSLLVFIPLLLSYVVLGRRSHIMDLAWVISSSTAIGLISLKSLLKNYYQINRYFYPVYLIIVMVVLYSLILAGHVYWGRAYDSDKYLEVKYLAEQVNNYPSKIADVEVIAVGDRSLHPSLNYLTRKSVVLFNSDTIAKLVENGKLQSAFDTFSIRYIIGYDQELSDLIVKNSQTINIAIWPEKYDLQKSLNYNKSWLLNLIK
ncbi:MAG: hypothetical protein Q7K65_02630 [Candidatus Buchananbacteria bacterium]|nr:hypothetical protein [Candidatus Buchananbacteria bacterium]